ncbi:fungal-specific transcription factor domain-containing protein [Chaetomidium leptoderma]|uniref:Fungal-specific transcription factor domain-containing protein n=1 Tax=Chaetomidium leptoderma TaxID=669021 RepID=A0AAN6VK05_9PEZI|nr:fungal-specific transcription factor domain-containing protein [Chaetomidium leptoderma]
MAGSRRTGSSHGVGAVGQSRQLPGAACEECRKRKLRCDRQRPQCGTCADADIVCEINHNRLARGPKKGDLKALRSRIGKGGISPVLNPSTVALERRLSIDHGDEALTILTGGPVMATTTQSQAATSSGSEGGSPTLVSPCQNLSMWDTEIHVQVPPLTPTSAPLSFSTFKFPPTPPSPPSRSTFVDDLMRADLDQLYFDRVHPNVPIFNHSRYFARSRQTPCMDGPNYMLCLQYAMWTLAMALSSQFESSRELLYNETRQMLEALDLADDDLHPVRIEQVQAWLLVAFYELARASYRRASISAGRAFRLVQLARLHEVDSPGSAGQDEDTVVKEERRRTFWVAYSLDRLICMRSRGPLTLAEEVVCTRLPSPELAFQSGHPIPGCFLPEAIASGDHNFLSPLAESAIVVTICGRALSHGQVSGVERAFGNPSLDFWLRHEWLDGMLTRTLDSLSINSPVVSALADPMLFFVFMMAHATTIFMCRIAEESSLGGMDGHCRPAVVEYQQRAMRAAREIANLAQAHQHIGFFKAHIFLPLAVSLGASQLAMDRKRRLDGHYSNNNNNNTFQNQGGGGGGSTLDGEFETCVDALRRLQSFNHLARDHLGVLESQELVFGGGL